MFSIIILIYWGINIPESSLSTSSPLMVNNYKKASYDSEALAEINYT